MQTQAPKGKPAEFKSMTQAERKVAMEQRKTEMEAKRTEMESWAKANGIDSQYLHLVMGGNGFGGRKGGFGGPCLNGTPPTANPEV